MANSNKIYFKNMLVEGSDYEELSQMHSPKKMLQIVGKKSEYGALPLIEKRGLRDCQYRAEVKFEESLKMGNKKNLAVLATGSGKTYLACLASYRLLNYTPTKRILFLVDRNNLARQTESEFSVFDRTEGQQKMGNLYTILRLPTGIFYANGVKTNVLFFEKGESTKDIWVYDYRTGIKHTMSTKPMTRAHLQNFVDCYKSGAIQERKATYDKDTNPNGRWRRFTQDEFNIEAEKENSLDFKWLDLEEKDERSIAEILDDMQAESDGIAEAVSILKNLLGGIEI